jgi:hypothetical protein
MGETIFDELERGWDAFTSRVVHRPYHDRQYPATPAPEEPVSLLATIEADAEQALGEVQKLVREKIPAAVADAKSLEGNPVVDALLAAAHVPVNALSIVVDVLNGLANIYPKPDPAAPADPAMGQPEPAQAA